MSAPGWSRSLVMVLVTASAVSCRFGNIHSSPRGIGLVVDATVRSAIGGQEGRRLDGELLAVTGDGLLLLRERQQVVLLGFDAVDRARPGSRWGGPREWVDFPEADSAAFENWRPYARHPFGLTPAQLDQLLLSVRQERLLRWRR